MKRGMKLDEYCIENNLEYLLDEWDYEKNDGVPHDYARGCDDHVNWICLECGYPWSAAINRRAGRVENGVIKRKPTGCPVCENLVVWEGHNDLESNRPDIAAEWDYEVNKPVRPSQVTCGRNKPQYGWICSYNPMHKWKQTVNVRVHGNHGKGTGCPKCVGRKISESLKKRALQDGENTLAKKFPEIAKEWNYEKNNGLTPDDVAPFCNDKADWICSVCNRGWSDFIGNRRVIG